MSKMVVADTGPLIALALVKLLPVLPKLFSGVYVPDGVIQEATKDFAKPGAQAIKRALDDGWIVRHSMKLSQMHLELAELLDQGEAEVLALAQQLNAVVLMDERRGRQVANKRGIEVTGTAAILIKAKQAGEIMAVKPLLDNLAQCGYRFSASLIRDVLRLSGE